MILTRPTNSYYGMKDIEQALMVKRAAHDLLLPTNIRLVPCIRHPDGVPISSRLRNIPAKDRAELSAVYKALELGRTAVAEGQVEAKRIIEVMRTHLEPRLSEFQVLYITAVNTIDFAAVQRLEIPFILHIAVQNSKVTHFDGLCIQSLEDLRSGPETIWLPV